jgi:zinc D-Ala-D-Ala carboxypeptidase
VFLTAPIKYVFLSADNNPMTSTDRISRYFTLAEVQVSSTADRLAIDNTLPPQLLAAAMHTGLQMDHLRELLDCPVVVTSWYRSLLTNRAVGSRDTSQHIRGEAVDFIAPHYGSPFAICKRILFEDFDFDQLILEHSWVHISFSANPNVPNRREALTLQPNNTFIKGIYDGRRETAV